MGRTVRELQHSMTSSEFTEWQAMDTFWPLPDRRADILTGLQLQAAYAGKSKRRVKCIPQWIRKPARQTADQLKSVEAFFAAKFGKKKK